MCIIGGAGGIYGAYNFNPMGLLVFFVCMIIGLFYQAGYYIYVLADWNVKKPQTAYVLCACLSLIL